MNAKRLGLYFFFGVFLWILYQLMLILSPFFVAVLGAGICAITFYPVHEYFHRRLKQYPNAAAGLSTSAIALIVIVPVLLLGWVFLKETAKVYPVARHWMETVRQRQAEQGVSAVPPETRALWEKTRDVLRIWNLDPQSVVLRNIDELNANMAHIARQLIRNMLFVLFNVFVLILTLFFFLRDGTYIIDAVTGLIPMSIEHKQSIFSGLKNTLHAVLRGLLIVSLLYGVLVGAGLAAVGVPFPVLLGSLAMFLAPIPFVGPVAIWVPVVGGLIVEGAVFKAVVLSAWCLVVHAALDQFLRPLIIGSRAKMPMLLLFLGLLGGLRVYGFVGLLLGPLLMSLVLAFINIYQQEYSWLLKEFKKSALSDA